MGLVSGLLVEFVLNVFNVMSFRREGRFFFFSVVLYWVFFRSVLSVWMIVVILGRRWV